MSITIERVKELREAIGDYDWQRNEGPDEGSAPIHNHYGQAILQADGPTSHAGPSIVADEDDLALIAAAPEIADLCIELAKKLARIEEIAGGAS